MIYVLLTYLFYPFLQLILSPGRKQRVKKILIIQTAKIGDLIYSTPVFRAVKKKYPDAHLTVMANPVTKELLEYNAYVDEVISMKNIDYKGLSGRMRLSNLIRKERYDVAICLNPNVPFAAVLLWGLVPERISVTPDFAGITFKLASVFFTYLEKHISGRLVLETYMQMLKAIGIESNNLTAEVYKSEDADAKAHQVIGDINKHIIGITVSSGNKLKELGAETIAQFINMLLDNVDTYIVFIGSEQDRDKAGIILDSITKKDRIIDATGRFSLGELPALIERLSLFIGVDTGITYMADALLIPIIDIAGPSDMSDQRPLGGNCIIIQRDLPCVPCSHTFRAPYSCERGDRICITSVSASEIIEAAKKLLKTIHDS